MQRRKFIRNISLGSLAAGFIPNYGLSNFLPPTPPAMLVPLGEAKSQIRHGALNLPVGFQENTSMPFDWLLQVHRNIFFKNGFTRSESLDLEIISILLEEAEGLEALQIQLSADATSLMVKDQLIAKDRHIGLKKIAAPLQNTQVMIADLEAGETYEFPFETATTFFVQLLEGAISCEQQPLDLNTGLALEHKWSLSMAATAKSRVLILART